MTIAAIILTAALVLITAYYAWQTNRTVEELRKARSANIVPRITLSFDYLGPKLAFLVIANNGIGPAIDVRAEIRYEPGGPTKVWKAPVMTPGERHRMRLPDREDPPEAPVPYESVFFSARYRDALGDPQVVEEVLRPQEYWDALVDSKTLPQRDPIDEIRREIEKLREAVEKIPRELRP